MPRAAYLAPAVIAGIVAAHYAVAILLTWFLRLPRDIGLPPWARGAGATLIPFGVAIVVWVFRHRGPRAVMESTYFTLLKLARRVPVEAPLGRTEPLVIAGPYRVVRHPLYSGVVLMVIGVAFAADRTAAFIGAALLYAWLRLIVAPFEERELIALFGPAYSQYARRTPALIPIPWRGRP